MRRSFLPALALILAVPAAAAVWKSQDLSRVFAAFAAPSGLLQGCGDVPEAVALAEELRDRALRIERYMESIEDRKAELAQAEQTLRERLVQLKSQKGGIRARRDTATEAVRDDRRAMHVEPGFVHRDIESVHHAQVSVGTSRFVSCVSRMFFFPKFLPRGDL